MDSQRTAFVLLIISILLFAAYLIHKKIENIEELQDDLKTYRSFFGREKKKNKKKKAKKEDKKQFMGIIGGRDQYPTTMLSKIDSQNKYGNKSCDTVMLNKKIEDTQNLPYEPSRQGGR